MKIIKDPILMGFILALVIVAFVVYKVKFQADHQIGSSVQAYSATPPEERPDMSTIMWHLLKEYPTTSERGTVLAANNIKIKTTETIIRHGQLKIWIYLGVSAYMSIYVENENGETLVYSSEWKHNGKWKDDFYAFALPIVEKHVAKERAEHEAKEKAKRESEQKVLGAYK